MLRDIEAGFNKGESVGIRKVKNIGPAAKAARRALKQRCFSDWCNRQVTPSNKGLNFEVATDKKSPKEGLFLMERAT